RLLAQRDHDVRETVHQVDLVDVRSRPSPRQVAVERERTPPLGEHAVVASQVEAGAQPVSRGEIALGLLGLRVLDRVSSDLRAAPTTTGRPRWRGGAASEKNLMSASRARGWGVGHSEDAWRTEVTVSALGAADHRGGRTRRR